MLSVHVHDRILSRRHSARYQKTSWPQLRSAVLVVLAASVIGCGGSPDVMSEAGLKVLDALYTAVTSRKPELVDHCQAQVAPPGNFRRSEQFGRGCPGRRYQTGQDRRVAAVSDPAGQIHSSSDETVIKNRRERPQIGIREAVVRCISTSFPRGTGIPFRCGIVGQECPAYLLKLTNLTALPSVVSITNSSPPASTRSPLRSFLPRRVSTTPLTRTSPDLINCFASPPELTTERASGNDRVQSFHRRARQGWTSPRPVTKGLQLPIRLQASSVRPGRWKRASRILWQASDLFNA